MGDGTENITVVQLSKTEARWLHNVIAEQMSVAQMHKNLERHAELWRLRAFLGWGFTNTPELFDFNVEIR